MDQRTAAVTGEKDEFGSDERGRGTGEGFMQKIKEGEGENESAKLSALPIPLPAGKLRFFPTRYPL